LFALWTRNQWKSVYLFAGAEDFLIEQALKQAVSRWLPDDAEGLNLDRMDGEKHAAADILAACRTVPFIGAVRVIRLDNTARLSPTDQGELAETLASLPAETRLLLIWGKEW